MRVWEKDRSKPMRRQKRESKKKERKKKKKENERGEAFQSASCI